jgi:hypothetical protein
MAISRGTPKVRRVHGKNFTHAQAEARLGEVIASSQAQGMNALGVDFHEVLLYLKNMSSRVCTCREIQMEAHGIDVVMPDAPKLSGIGEEQTITLDWAKPLFGEPGEAYSHQDDSDTDDSMYDLDEDEGGRPLIDQTEESSPDCGICYRSGFVPGFEQYGQTRFVFTTLDFVDQRGYTIERDQQPHGFARLGNVGTVSFPVRVPKYFRAVQFSIRNNHEVLSDRPLYNSAPLSMQDLRDNAGKEILVEVSAEFFTHFVLVFDLGSDPIHANIAQLSKVTDWSKFETIGGLNVLLPMIIKELPVGSLIIVPSKHLGLRITDVQYLRVALGSNIDWSCSTRVMQPMEATKYINKGFKLF